MATEAFLFDIGNVLVTFDFRVAAAGYKARSTCNGDPIELISDLTVQLEDGRLPGVEFLPLAMERMDFKGTAEEFVSIWEEIFEPNQPVWDLVEQLQGRWPLHILSNTSDIHHQSLFRDFAIFSRFDSGVYSYAAGLAKPDPAIYAHTAEVLGIDPATTFYVDDLVENYEAGKAAGFDAFHYHPGRHEELLSTLRERGVLHG